MIAMQSGTGLVPCFRLALIHRKRNLTAILKSNDGIYCLVVKGLFCQPQHQPDPTQNLRAFITDLLAQAGLVTTPEGPLTVKKLKTIHLTVEAQLPPRIMANVLKMPSGKKKHYKDAKSPRLMCSQPMEETPHRLEVVSSC